MLIHGTGGSGDQWQDITDRLQQRGFIVHRPTLRFHGLPYEEVKRQVSEASITDYVDDLTTLAGSLDSPPVILGHSLGGLLAQLLAARIECKGVILGAPAPSWGMFPYYPSMVRIFFLHHLQPFFWKKPVIISRKMFDWGIMNEQEPTLRDEFMARLVPESGKAYAQMAFWYLDPSKSTLVNYDRVKAPILVISGDRDRIVAPRISRLTAANYANTTHRIIKGSDHMMFWGRFLDESLEIISTWLEDQNIKP